MTDFGGLSRKCEADVLVVEGGGATKTEKIVDGVGEHEELVKECNYAEGDGVARISTRSNPDAKALVLALLLFPFRRFVLIHASAGRI